MVKLHPWEYIFSITNDSTDKLIMFLGIPIRIDQSKYYKKICEDLPVESNKIVFSNFEGGSYGCNPKYIAEEIIRRNLPYDLVWLVKNVSEEAEKNNFPEKIRLAGYSSKIGLKELATAKIWIDNQRKIYHIKKGLVKKNGQYYIQTWHGSLGIKKLDADVEAFTGAYNQEWVNRAKLDSSMMDYIITNSEFDNNIFKTAFWFNNEMKQYGHPRNDVFFKSDEEKKRIREKVCSSLQIPISKKIVLYVPSFRDDKRLSCYGLNTDKLISALENKFGGQWVCISRLHPRLKNYTSELIPQKNNVVDGTFYPDIQELLVSADVVITDYSSCIFDFMLSRRAGFIFATDISEFNTERGFYYPLEATPFPIASSNEKLMENIANFDMDKYRKETEIFLKEKGCTEDGHASERVVDLIEKIMNGEVKNA